MTAPHKWKHGLADAYTYRNGAIAEEFLDLVVRPSVAALERKHLELASSDDLAIAGFMAHDHRDLIKHGFLSVDPISLGAIASPLSWAMRWLLRNGWSDTRSTGAYDLG